jgi:hypothetical protein
MSTSFRSIIAMASAAAAGIAIAMLPPAACAKNATQFMNGGAFCFRIGESIPGGWTTTLMMVVSRPLVPGIGHFRGGVPANIVHVDAVEHGTQATFPPNAYVTPLTGSATIAPTQVSGEDLVQISLTGSDFGIDQVGGPTGIWISSQAITLNLLDLTGHDTGYKTFTPIDGGQPGESARSAVDDAVTPISCTDF